MQNQKAKQYNVFKTPLFTEEFLSPLTKEDLNNPNFVKLNEKLECGY